ncbi:MAG: DUF4143 domain-containing protein, partial [bacterium]|nr:DUF4143 domain-containing protein [bacterium]
KFTNKVFFIDPGLRNLAQKNFAPLPHRQDLGSMIENLVYIELEKNRELLDDIHYWRTKSKAEVDFIYSHGQTAIPIEVKTGSAKIGTLTRSFHSFIAACNPPKAVFLNKDAFGVFKVNLTEVYYIPVHWFLLSGIRMVT